MEDKIDLIFEGLKQKSTTKQTIYRNTLKVFEELREVALELVTQLTDRLSEVDSHVIIDYRNISELEFHIKFSGDLLVFIMHSNVVTFPDDKEIMKTEYVEADFKRRFFGHIMAYNFMADSIRYNRQNDPGYLLGRLLINIENHFYLEGVEQMDLQYTDMSKNILDHNVLRLMVESAMIAAVNNDLMAPDLNDIKKISVKDKLDNQQVSRNQKVGFSFGGITS
jgi:hypothetical protein